jgi:hypothetical protein
LDLKASERLVSCGLAPGQATTEEKVEELKTRVAPMAYQYVRILIKFSYPYRFAA